MSVALGHLSPCHVAQLFINFNLSVEVLALTLVRVDTVYVTYHRSDSYESIDTHVLMLNLTLTRVS